MNIRSYQDLTVWQRAMDLVELIYQSTTTFPKHEIYGLTSQIRRAAVSVPSNIAEGAERRTSGEYLQFLGNAQGSLAELETQIILSFRLGYIEEDTQNTILEKAAEVGRLNHGLRRAISTKSNKPA